MNIEVNSKDHELLLGFVGLMMILMVNMICVNMILMGICKWHWDFHRVHVVL